MTEKEPTSEEKIAELLESRVKLKITTRELLIGVLSKSPETYLKVSQSPEDKFLKLNLDVYVEIPMAAAKRVMYELTLEATDHTTLPKQ